MCERACFFKVVRKKEKNLSAVLLGSLRGCFLSVLNVFVFFPVSRFVRQPQRLSRFHDLIRKIRTIRRETLVHDSVIKDAIKTFREKEIPFHGVHSVCHIPSPPVTPREPYSRFKKSLPTVSARERVSVCPRLVNSYVYFVMVLLDRFLRGNFIRI